MQLYTWDQAGFEQAYRRSFYKPKGCGVNLIHSCRCMEKDITYSRDFFETNTLFENRAKNIINKINLPVGSSVLVVGCALGYLLVELGAKGMVPVGVDNSQYIQSMKNRPGEKVSYDIHNIDVTDSQFASDLNRAAKVNKFDCIITEDVLTSYNTFTNIFNNCEEALKSGKPLTNIVHLVDLTCGPPFNKKTLAEWKQIKPEYTWLNTFGDDL